MDADGLLARGDRDEVANWHGYGAEVLAVADGVVAATRDDLTESRTLSGRPRPPLEESEGNFIVLDLGDGRYAFY
jgi:murein DD-endopeptidase